MTFSKQGNKTPYCLRGGRYYRKKLSAANISEFFKLSANYRYRKLDSILFNKHNWKHCSKNRLTEKQHKSCSLPETFVAAKPTQTMVPDINLLWEGLLASMSNKMWWLRRWWEYCGIFCFWLDWGLAKWWRGGGGPHSKSADKILRQRCEIIKITKFSWTTTCHVVSIH